MVVPGSDERMVSDFSCLSDGASPEELVDVLEGGTGFLQIVLRGRRPTAVASRKLESDSYGSKVALRALRKCA